MTNEIEDYVIKQLLAEILEEIHTLSGCQSVGIRLHNNGDYPYYVYKGFPNFFILKENSLCARDSEGNPIRDERGILLLECMCGNFIKGRFDPERPYFTEKGSFWTKRANELLDVATEEGLGRTRNMCEHSGYESVDLIPVRACDRTLGLIQINDPRENMFTSEVIKKYEFLADHVGQAVFNALEIQKKMAVILDLVKKFQSAEN